MEAYENLLKIYENLLKIYENLRKSMKIYENQFNVLHKLPHTKLATSH